MEKDVVGGWKRPESVPYPSVWSRFEGRKKVDGVLPKFWIQDLPEQDFELAIGYMANGFLDDEPICNYSEVTSEPASVEDFIKMWRDVVQKKAALACYMENPNPNGKPIIAGINMTYVVQKDEPDSTQLTGSKSLCIMESLEYVSKMKDVFAELGTDSYLYAIGLYVLPEFRGQNVGFELLKAREPLCRSLGIKGSATVFTATASQILAARVGFKVLSEISYEDMGKIDPKLIIPGIQEHTKDLKYMYIKYT